MVLARAPPSRSSTSFAILPSGPRRDHQILACTLLVLPMCLFFLHPHFGRRCGRKRIRLPASLGWVSGRTSLPARAIGWKAKAAHPSKPCRTTSALARRAYSSAGQAASAFHSMAILQVFQDESNPNPTAFKKLHSATDLAQCATKMTAQAIGRSMASLMVLERHLWLNLMEMKDADKVPFLDSPVSPTSLFGPAVEGFAERFTAEQKSSQAMWHFLPKHSSRPKMVPTKLPAKAALPAVQTAAKPEPPRSRLARSHAPKHVLHERGLHIGSTQQRSHLALKWWVCWRKEQWKQFPQFRASQASTAVTSSSPRRMVV